LSAARFRGGAKVLRARRSRHPLGKAVAAALAGLALACPVPARAVDGTWNVPGSGVWWTSSPQYWVGGVPSQAGDTANFLNAITSDATVNIPYVPVTAGRLVFDDDNNYTITGGSTMSVTLTNPGSTSASIEVGNTFGNGAHRIDTTVYVKAPLTIANASTGTLTFGYLVSGTQPITLTGPGRVRFEGNNRSTLASELDVTRGTLELAAGDPRYLPGGTGAWRVTAGASIVVAGGTAAGQTPAPLGNGIWLAGAGAAGVGGAMRFEGRPFALTGGMMLTDSATLVQAADAGGASGVVDLGGTNGAGALLGSGTLTLSGAADGSALGTGTFSGDGASFRLNVSAGHSGGTVVDHGVLWVGSQGSLATAGLVTVRPGAMSSLVSKLRACLSSPPAMSNWWNSLSSSRRATLAGSSPTLVAKARRRMAYSPGRLRRSWVLRGLPASRSR
jgi:hypothetical protein